MKSWVEYLIDNWIVGILKNYVLRFSLLNSLANEDAKRPLPEPGIPEISIKEIG
jgi:hypothetical protein